MNVDTISAKVISEVAETLSMEGFVLQHEVAEIDPQTLIKVADSLQKQAEMLRMVVAKLED
jgi:ribosomal protein S8